MTRNKLYLLLTITCLAGYSWLYFNSTSNSLKNDDVTICVLKNISGIPCPSCGSTRAVLSIIKGKFSTALYTNPFGFIIGLILLITPLWLVTDLISKKNTLFLFYKKIELFLSKPQFYLPLIILVLANWAWNIAKGL